MICEVAEIVDFCHLFADFASILCLTQAVYIMYTTDRVMSYLGSCTEDLS